MNCSVSPREVSEEIVRSDHHSDGKGGEWTNNLDMVWPAFPLVAHDLPFGREFAYPGASITEVKAMQVHISEEVMLDPEKRTGAVAEFEDKLRAQIVGQDRAVRQLVSIYQTHLAGLSPS